MKMLRITFIFLTSLILLEPANCQIHQPDRYEVEIDNIWFKTVLVFSDATDTYIEGISVSFKKYNR